MSPPTAFKSLDNLHAASGSELLFLLLCSWYMGLPVVEGNAVAVDVATTVAVAATVAVAVAVAIFCKAISMGDFWWLCSNPVKSVLHLLHGARWQ